VKYEEPATVSVEAAAVDAMDGWRWRSCCGGEEASDECWCFDEDGGVGRRRGGERGGEEWVGDGVALPEFICTAEFGRASVVRLVLAWRISQRYSPFAGTSMSR
jgi:hypothetical protein